MGQEDNSVFWQSLYSEKKIRKMREKISAKPPEKIKERFSNLLEQASKYNNRRMFAKGMLIYTAAEGSLKKELGDISVEIQQKDFGVRRGRHKIPENLLLQSLYDHATNKHPGDTPLESFDRNLLGDELYEELREIQRKREEESQDEGGQ